MEGGRGKVWSLGRQHLPGDSANLAMPERGMLVQRCSAGGAKNLHRNLAKKTAMQRAKHKQRRESKRGALALVSSMSSQRLATAATAA